jgi:hypothetical protein
VPRDEAFSDAVRQRQSHDDGVVPAAEVALLADTRGAEHIEALCLDLALNGSRHHVPHSNHFDRPPSRGRAVKASLLPCEAIVGSHAVQ